jgi:hypothetical protein
MLKQLEDLLDLYRNNLNKFKFENDSSNILEFADKKFDNLLLSISLNNINDIYYIFLYIEEETKIIFKGLIKQSNENIKNIYDQVFNDLSSLDLEAFLSKYHVELEKNFS